MVDKVGGKKKQVAEGTEPKAKKEKKTRKPFDIKTAKAMISADGKAPATLQSCLNKDGKLTEVPVTVKDGDTVVYEGFNPTMHKPLKKSDFADISAFMLFQAFIIGFKAQRLQDLATKKRERALHIRKFGDEATRKKAQKYARMKDQLAKLKEQLAEEGITAEDMDKE